MPLNPGYQTDGIIEYLASQRVTDWLEKYTHAVQSCSIDSWILSPDERAKMLLMWNSNQPTEETKDKHNG